MIVNRPLTVGDKTFRRGDTLTPEARRQLSDQRVDVMVRGGYLSRSEDVQVADLDAQVTALSARVDQLEAAAADRTHVCESCEYVGTSAHALKVHVGKTHKESS